MLELSHREILIFSFAAGIRRFVFTPSGLNVPELIDNLQFEATSVPEPASLILLSLVLEGS